MRKIEKVVKAVGAAENRATGLTARRRDEYIGLTLLHGVVAGNKASIAGYSAAVWAYYRLSLIHI